MKVPTLQPLFVALAVGLVAAMVSSLLVPASGWLARRLGVLDTPGPRKVHDTPTPRLGGLAVYMGFVTPVVVGYALVPLLPVLGPSLGALDEATRLLSEAHRVWDKLAGILVGATAVLLVGLADDCLGSRFSPAAKAAGQVVAALVLTTAGVRTSVLPADWMNVALTVFWVVGITNAFNLLDNMDGLSAGVATVAAGVLMWNAASRGEFFIVLLIAALAGSLLGFLRHNFHPASVFLGDCGSLFIGFMMASLTLLERYVSHASSSLFPVAMPILVLGIPLLDTATVMFIRLRERRPLYVGDKRHLSHRLVALGFSTKKAVLCIYLAGLCFGLGATLLPDASPGQTALVLAQAVGFAALLCVLMFHERPANGASGT